MDLNDHTNFCLFLFLALGVVPFILAWADRPRRGENPTSEIASVFPKDNKI